MNLILFFLTFTSFSAVVRGMTLKLKRRIQTCHQGDYRSVMALYNKYTENNSSKLVRPCDSHKRMGIILQPQTFTSIKSDVITSLNTNMALTLDGHSNFSIHAIMKCTVKKDDREVFKFFVLLMPEWGESYTKGAIRFIPVYDYGSADENWQLFAVEDVYDLQVLKNTFTGNPQDHQSRIPAELQYPQLVPIIKESLGNIAEIVDSKHHFDNFVLLLDDENRILIPAITIIKIRQNGLVIRFAYMIMFREDPNIHYPPNPFHYPAASEQGIRRYQIYNAHKTIDGIWAFSLDINLVTPQLNVLRIPEFISKIRW